MNRNEWIIQAARLQAAEQPFALVTVLRAQAPTSGKAGDKAVVTADGQIHGWIGGGCAQPAVLRTVMAAVDTLARVTPLPTPLVTAWLGLAAVPLLGERIDALTLVFALAVVATVFLGRRLGQGPARVVPPPTAKAIP